MTTTAGHLYKLNTEYPDRSWFGITDVGLRFTISALLYYWHLVTTPFSFFRFVYQWNLQWHGKVFGLLSAICFFIYPFAVMFWSLWKKLKEKLFPDKDNWMLAGPGRVFFLSPDGYIATWLWASYLELSQMVGVYVMCHNSCTAQEMDEAVEHSIYDRITDKDFWRQLMTSSEMRIPQELGKLTEGKLKLNKGCSVQDVDIVAKVSDSYLGIGDKFLEYGKDFTDFDDLAKMAEEKKEWKGKTVLFLEWVRPLESLGVHSLDIVTISTASGPKVLSVLIWAECTGSSSHTARGGYCVDVETETIVAPASWYSPFYATQKGRMVGTKLPGVKKAVEQALRGHEACPLNWLKMIGWDCMFLKKKNEICFFEGNFAASRIHRRITFGFSHAAAFVANYCWPFAKKIVTNSPPAQI